MRIPLAQEGVPFIVGCLLALSLASFWAAGRGGGSGRWLAVGACATLLLFVAWFFRDPERRPQVESLVAVSPADGTVQSVGPAYDPDFSGPATRITIFLNIFNVHVQRAPMDGKVTHYSHSPGRFLAAWREEASAENERATLTVETPAGPILVRQIAGLVARRIVTYPREGDELTKGERIGIIRFGSRVDLFVPADWLVLVAAGDKVRGGITPVAQGLDEVGEVDGDLEQAPA